MNIILKVHRTVTDNRNPIIATSALLLLQEKNELRLNVDFF